MQADGDLFPIGQGQPPRPGHPPIVADRPPRGLPHHQRNALMRAAHLRADLPQRQARAFSRKARCLCSTVRCGRIRNLLSSSRIFSTHRGIALTIRIRPVRLRLMCDTAASLGARHFCNASGVGRPLKTIHPVASSSDWLVGFRRGYMELASYTRTLSMIGMPRTSDSASSRLSALRIQ